MKKLVFILSITIISQDVFSQPVIDSTVCYYPGYVVSRTGLDTIKLSSESAGDNVTWDFSYLEKWGGYFRTANDINAVPENDRNQLEPGDFNLYWSALDVYYDHYRLEDNTLYFIGQTRYPEYRHYFELYDDNDITNARADLKFPVTYGKTYTDSYNHSRKYFFIDQVWNINGSITVSYIGYGSVRFPENLVDSIALIKTTIDYIVTRPENPDYHIIETKYEWFRNNTPGPILYYHSSRQTGASGTTETYYVNESVSGEIPEKTVENTITAAESSEKQELLIYPTFSDGIINIKGSAYERIMIKDLNGATVFNDYIDSSGTASFDISFLGSGMYLITNGSEFRKIVITK